MIILGGGFMTEILAFLATVDDNRASWKIKYSLADIILLIFLSLENRPPAKQNMVN